MATPARPVIRAAGVVLSRGVGKDLEVAVIHRRRRGDWSLPKGKIEGTEHVIEAAVRECEEETGFRPVLEVPLPTQHYQVDGSAKTVEYSRASAAGGEFSPNREVDRLRWLGSREAMRLLTYPRDAELVALCVRTPPTVPYMLVRHASAEKREDWARRTGNDRDDPARGLLERGEWEAERLVGLVRAFGIGHLHSSDAERCMATLRPSATALGVGIRIESSMNEDQYKVDPQLGRERTTELFKQPWASVICSHRPVIPGQLDAIRALAGGPRFVRRMPPGGFVIYHRTWVNRPGDDNVRIVAAEQHDPPAEHES